MDPNERRVHMLRNEMEGEKISQNIRKNVQTRLSVLESQVPSITEQYSHVHNWWKQLAQSYNPDIHYSFITDLPVSLVTDFLICKQIVPNNTEAFRLYKTDIREYELQGSRYKRMAFEDFMNIFNKRMFVDALMRVILKIENTGGTINYPSARS